MRNSKSGTCKYCNCLHYSAKSTKSLLHNIILLPCYLSIWCYDNIQIHRYPMNWFTFMASFADFSLFLIVAPMDLTSPQTLKPAFFLKNGAWWVPKTRYYQTLLTNIANMYTEKVYFFRMPEKSKDLLKYALFGLQKRTNKLLRVSLKV